MSGIDGWSRWVEWMDEVDGWDGWMGWMKEGGYGGVFKRVVYLRQIDTTIRH